MELVRQRFPSLLGRQGATKFIIVNNIDVGLVILEQVEIGTSLLLLSNTIFIFSRCLILVAAAGLQSVNFSLSQQTSVIREPEIALSLDVLALSLVSVRLGY